MYKRQDNCKRKILHINYLVMHRIQMHTGAISWLEYGSCVRTSDNPLAYARELSSLSHNLRGTFIILRATLIILRDT